MCGVFSRRASQDKGAGRGLGTYLDVSHTDPRGAALHIAVVAAPRAPLHLHTGWPHHKVGIGGIHHAPGDLKDRCSRLALSKDSWLSSG